ncbi:hypothetical protein M5689_003480 [Euphorbia peplus]|nr:hypothetical protein M5689_003480 [Euphorbia peplus]
MGHVHIDCESESVVSEDGEWPYDASLRATPSKLRVVKSGVVKKAYPGSVRAGDWKASGEKSNVSRKLFSEEIGVTSNPISENAMNNNQELTHSDANTQIGTETHVVNLAQSMEGIENSNTHYQVDSLVVSDVVGEKVLLQPMLQQQLRKVHIKRLARAGVDGNTSIEVTEVIQPKVLAGMKQRNGEMVETEEMFGEG